MHYRQHKLLFLITALVITQLGGCRPEAESESADASDQVTPEESFEAIVALLRDGLELPGGTASGFVSSSSNSRSRFRVHTEVTSALTPPAAPDDTYHGIITVSTQSLYSLRTTSEKKKDDEDKRSSRNSGNPLDDSAESDTGFSTFDNSLVTEAPKAGDSDAIEVEQQVQRHEDRDERKFELIYRSGRWELLTKTDPDTEASIQNAFDRALRLQPR